MFKGQFKSINATGFPVTYGKNDKVLYQGKLYQAIESTQSSPLSAPQSWSYVSLSNPYHGSVPPIDPKENQIWISDSGISYIYYFDGNTYQWIAI